MSRETGASGIPFVVAAASGTGKTTVCRRVIEKGCERGDLRISFSVSHTTRPRRQEEREGVDYHFVSLEEFHRLAQQGAFLEWAVYNGNHYGTSWSSIEGALADGRDVLLEIEVQGACQVRERREDARLLFLLPPSMQALRSRLEDRGTDSAQQVASRLELAREELGAAAGFHYAVVNDDLETCVDAVLAIIGGERSGEIESLRQRFEPRAALAVLRGRDGD